MAEIEKEKKKTGRPLRDFDRKVFEGLCHVQCTFGEIESIFWTDKRTLDKWVEREYKESFSDVYKRFADEGKMSVRRYQFAHAKTNASMAMFLGKVMLGQRDTPPPEAAPNNAQLEELINAIKGHMK